MNLRTTLTKTTRNSLLAMLTGQPLAMTEAGLGAMLAALEMEPQALWGKPGDRSDRGGIVTQRDGVAVIDIHGPIFANAGLLSMFFALADPQEIAFEFMRAMESQSVNDVVFHVDSPGGHIALVNELSQMIAAARGKKRIIAYVSNSAASGAYWIASGADEIVIEETAQAGSIGVIVRYPKQSKNDYAVEIVSSLSPKKRVDPESDAGKAQILAYADTLAEIFLQTVAANRGVTIEKAKSDFGQGDVFVGKQAVSAGLADRVGTFEGLMETLTSTTVGRYKMEKTAITTIIQLAAAYPELVAQMQQAAREEGVKSVDVVGAGNDAAAKERERILGLAAIQFGAEASDKFKAVVTSGVTVEQFQAISALNPPAKAAKTKGDETREKMITAIEGAGAPNPGPGAPAGGKTQTWDDAWKAIQAEKKCSVQAAMKEAAAKFPELHAAYVEALRPKLVKA